MTKKEIKYIQELERNVWNYKEELCFKLQHIEDEKIEDVKKDFIKSIGMWSMLNKLMLELNIEALTSGLMIYNPVVDKLMPMYFEDEKND